MFLSSRGLAFLLALCVALFTTSFLSLVKETPTMALFVTFLVSLTSSYLLGYMILEFLIFKEISQIHDTLEKLKNTEFDVEEEKVNPMGPFRQMQQELYSYASNKQSEIDELKRLENFRREFLADVSHELKTPIFAAQGFVHTLLDGAIKDKSVRDKFLKKAAKSLDGLDDLVHDLIVISQMESGQIRMHMEDFNIYELTREIVDQMENKAEKKGVDIHFQDGTVDTWVVGDPRRIEQVMTNLITNAIKYSNDKGEVMIGFDIVNDQVLISVEDDGIGISEEHQKRIF